MSAKLKRKTLNELLRIIEKDYKVSLTDEKANELGISLLRLTGLALSLLARKDKNKKHENS